MVRETMTLAQAEAQLLEKGCTFHDRTFLEAPGSGYRMISVPYDVYLGSSFWVALYCILRHMPVTWMFEERKRAKRSQE